LIGGRFNIGAYDRDPRLIHSMKEAAPATEARRRLPWSIALYNLATRKDLNHAPYDRPATVRISGGRGAIQGP